jgi:hypothetical protein
VNGEGDSAARESAAVAVGGVGIRLSAEGQ